MKVKVHENLLVTFASLEPGTCFEIGGRYYMKLRSAHGEANAVNLQNATLAILECDEMVAPYYDTEVTLR